MERAVDIVGKLKGGEIKPAELVEECLEKIERLNPKINAFVTLNEKAIEEAKKADASTPLAGLPIAIKDNVETRGDKDDVLLKVLRKLRSRRGCCAC